MASQLKIELHKPVSTGPSIVIRRSTVQSRQKGLKIDKKGIHPLSPQSNTRGTGLLPWRNVLRLCYKNEGRNITPERAKKEAVIGTISLDLGAYLRSKDRVVYIAARSSKRRGGQQSFGRVILTLGITDSGVRMALRDHDIDDKELIKWGDFFKEVSKKIEQIKGVGRLQSA